MGMCLYSFPSQVPISQQYRFVVYDLQFPLSVYDGWKDSNWVEKCMGFSVEDATGRILQIFYFVIIIVFSMVWL